jgi:L-threonylcarbamoyladenylate synthase
LIVSPTPENIASAVALLRAGSLVALPTETVYGLGADASNPKAVAKIFTAKGRPQDHPVIVHLADASQVSAWAREVPEVANKLAARFWPGPLTIIFKRAAGVNDAVTGGQDSVGLRVPGHPVAQQLLRAFGGGIAAPSANRFGRISPTTAAHVAAEFGAASEMTMIVDGGACDVGIESTIVDVSRGGCMVLRPGRIGAAQIAEVVGRAVGTATQRAPDAPRASGTLEVHYAPVTPLRLVASSSLFAEVRSADAVLAFGPAAAGIESEKWIVAKRDARAYAHDLYANLRSLDALACARILVEAPPDEESWAAINDRLRRAAAANF